MLAERRPSAVWATDSEMGSAYRSGRVAARSADVGSLLGQWVSSLYTVAEGCEQAARRIARRLQVCPS